MSIYKMIECDRCKDKIIIGEKSKNWFICVISSSGMIFSLLESGYKSPDTFPRMHFCVKCGGGIFHILGTLLKKEMQPE